MVSDGAALEQHPGGTSNGTTTAAAVLHVLTPMQRQRNKGIICKQFLTKRSCHRHHECPYLHIAEGESKPLPEAVCSFFSQGACLRDGCRFFHGTEERLQQLRAAGLQSYRLQDEMEVLWPPDRPELYSVEAVVSAPSNSKLIAALSSPSPPPPPPPPPPRVDMIRTPERQQQAASFVPMQSTGWYGPSSVVQPPLVFASPFQPTPSTPVASVATSGLSQQQQIVFLQTPPPAGGYGSQLQQQQQVVFTNNGPPLAQQQLFAAAFSNGLSPYVAVVGNQLQYQNTSSATVQPSYSYFPQYAPVPPSSQAAATPMLVMPYQQPASTLQQPLPQYYYVSMPQQQHQ